MTSETTPSVFRRHIFYVSGFDPRGAGFLHKTCVEETRKWSELTGSTVTVGPRKRTGEGTQMWDIDARIGSTDIQTRFEFLAWDDIIRKHWEKREWLVFVQGFLLLMRRLTNGIYVRAWRECWPMAVTMTTPAAIVTICGLAALLLLVSIWLFLSSSLGGTVAGVLLIVVAAGLMAVLARNIDRYKPAWTGRTDLCVEKFASGSVSGLDARVDSMAGRVLDVLSRSDRNEILIIGHSFGTVLAPLVAARVLARCEPDRLPDSGLTLVTLGQIQPLVAWDPKAEWYRHELAGLARADRFFWLDVTSPPDGACCALVDPLGFLPPETPHRPKLLNAQFHKTFAPERLERARKNRMMMHFFYLQSPDMTQPDTDLYDFIAMIAGPGRTRDRYAARPSASQPFFRKPR